MSRQRKMMSRHSSLLLEGFIGATEISVSQQSLVKARSFYVATELPEMMSRQSISYVATESSRTWGSQVAT